MGGERGEEEAGRRRRLFKPRGRSAHRKYAKSVPGKMSARDEDTFAEEGAEMDEAGSDDDDEGVEMEEEEGAVGEEDRKVYVPGIEPLQPGEELEMDRSAYRMYHECQTGELKPLTSLHNNRT